ncbi:dockerin type I domain-containing protein [Algisphaera agarilytica]|uniref:Dockerin domain-containing protein n=1 Tax=Algisphaera agarilytica TaxID=1385975 RepID=A0A7X0LK55_9BACT|nr:dockerin type I domain-containing protein [Algisphaera agarilytica]MBB6429479.1 hypothetical protein [Algisphaera agarilytica]
MTHPDDPQLPDDLIAELKRRDAQPFADTDRLDERIRLAIDAHYAPTDLVATASAPASWRFRRRLIGAGLAAAAAVGFVVWLNPNTFSPPADPVAQVAPSPELPHDFNRDGALDILDVMRLAKHVQDTPPSGPLADSAAVFDVNHDQRIDAQDVQTLGRSIVRLASEKDGEV